MYSPAWQYVISITGELANTQANIVGNYKISGTRLVDDYMVHLFETGHGFAVYLDDNYDETYRTEPEDAQDLVIGPEERHYVVDKPFAAPPVVTTPPQDAYRQVLANAGATKPLRDSVDARLVAAVEARSGEILDRGPTSPSQWPQLATGEPYPDLDHDGMDDRWEVQHGLDPRNPNDGREDRNGDGWTNLEEFLQQLAGDPD
jgi:hypothetical protein